MVAGDFKRKKRGEEFSTAAKRGFQRGSLAGGAGKNKWGGQLQFVHGSKIQGTNNVVRLNKKSSGGVNFPLTVKNCHQLLIIEKREEREEGYRWAAYPLKIGGKEGNGEKVPSVFKHTSVQNLGTQKKEVGCLPEGGG